jgi:DNA repair protein RecO (recombination protein O)
MADRAALAGLNAVTALLSFCLPEREAHVDLYRRTEALLDLLGQGDVWPLAYLRWELTLLEDMGYALDLTCCAVTGQDTDLIYVSPKSGRAVSRSGAGDWADRLLPLPDVLRGAGDASDASIIEALGTTGYFLKEHLARGLGEKPLPEARARLLEVLRRGL